MSSHHSKVILKSFCHSKVILSFKSHSKLIRCHPIILKSFCHSEVIPNSFDDIPSFKSHPIILKSFRSHSIIKKSLQTHSGVIHVILQSFKSFYCHSVISHHSPSFLRHSVNPPCPWPKQIQNSVHPAVRLG